MVKKVKKNDAIMTGILVTRFNMGLVNVEDLEEMAKDMSGSERSSGKKVLAVIGDSAYTLARAMAATINSGNILIFHCALNEFNIISDDRSKTLLLEGITKWLTWMEISRTRKNQKS